MSIPEGDYEKGKKIFKQRCLQCHVVDSAATKTGPTLNGVMGRKSGTVPGFDYSPANKSKVRLFLLMKNSVINNAYFRVLYGHVRHCSSTYWTQRNTFLEQRWSLLVSRKLMNVLI